MDIYQGGRPGLGSCGQSCRWAVPVCPRAKGGAKEHPRCSIGHSDSASVEPWRRVFLLLPLDDGAPPRRSPAVCPEQEAGPKVWPRPLEQDWWTWVETDAGYSGDTFCGQSAVKGRAKDWTRTDCC